MAARSYKDYGMSTGEYEAFVLPAYPVKDRSGSGVAKRSAHAPSPFPRDASRSGVTPALGTSVSIPHAPDSIGAMTALGAHHEESRSSITARRPSLLRGVLFVCSGAAVGVLVAMVARQHISAASTMAARPAPQVDSSEAVAPVVHARTGVRTPVPPGPQDARLGIASPSPHGAAAMMPPASQPGAMPQVQVPAQAQGSLPVGYAQMPPGSAQLPPGYAPRNPVAVVGGLELKAPPKKAAPPPVRHAAPAPARRSAAAPPRSESAAPAAPAQDLVQKGRAMADEAL